jgi:hypothetical protein
MGENTSFARCYVKSESLNLLPKTQISISGAYFSAVETEADFFNRIDRSLPIMVTTRLGQIRCNRWSERMQVTGQVECK